MDQYVIAYILTIDFGECAVLVLGFFMCFYVVVFLLFFLEKRSFMCLANSFQRFFLL